MTSKQKTLKYVIGAERVYLENLIETDELRSEMHYQRGELVSAAELMQRTRFLRRLLPPTSHVHNREWNNGDLFAVDVAGPTRLCATCPALRSSPRRGSYERAK
jgi:hypothetical protein